MSTPESSEPVEPEASAVSAEAAAPEFATDTVDETVAVRRAPRYGRFILLGVALGAVIALILTFAFPENAQFDRGQVFGFLLLGLGTIGAAFGAAVALVFDRVLSRRGGQAIVAHENTHPVE
ncbi:hypothetical protein [Agromyces protaetiae]|uniref:hypothetical protein n=1 Tax=Agromyces protaetiae TaxID=2509455 RepID=UPI001AA0AD03|nr:hypothetical protein [Agromyces protaetiae]